MPESVVPDPETRRSEAVLDRARRYRDALIEVEAIAEPAMDAAKLGTPAWRALRDVLDVARRAREGDA